MVKTASWEWSSAFLRCLRVPWMFGESQRAKSRVRVPRGISVLIQSKPKGSFPASRLTTVSWVLWLLLPLWGERCSRVHAVPAPETPVPVVTTVRRSSRRNSPGISEAWFVSRLWNFHLAQRRRPFLYLTIPLPLAFFWWNCPRFISLISHPVPLHFVTSL